MLMKRMKGTLDSLFKTTFSTFKSFKKVVDELKRKIDLI
jgi:hypothetical protein